MIPQRVAGIVILVVGVVLLVMGLTATDSLADQANRAISGHYTDHTTWYILGGVVLGLIGAGMALMGPMGPRHGHA
jgi:Protein of unknown function (DUF3185)